MTLPVVGFLSLQLGLGFSAASTRTALLRKATVGTASSAPTMPASTAARGDGQHDGQRMDRHRAAHHQRLQHVALQLLHSDDEAERDQRVDEALGEQCDDDGEESGDRPHRPAG